MIGVERLFNKAGQLFMCQRSSAFSYYNSASLFLNPIRFNSNRAAICRVNRLQYLRQYPTTVVNPDGSTFTIRYFEPRRIIKLPVDITTLSEPDRQVHLKRRKPMTKVILEEDFADDTKFDSSKYLNLVKKK
jgi:large subunit ribosomal protein L55